MQKVTTDQLQTEVHKWQEAAKEAAIRASVFADTCADAYLISAGYEANQQCQVENGQHDELHQRRAGTSTLM